ncbi:MAG: sulfatase-like hydrolase/transferase [Planctomycetota bacterium]
MCSDRSLTVFLALATTLAAPAQAPAPRVPPNIVLVVADDLGWTDLACQGSRFYETPNLDRLASQGIRFTDAYAAAAVCSPTRAAVLTGRSPSRTGVTDWIRARFQRGGVTPDANPTEYVGGPRRRLLCPPNPFWLELDEVTLAEALRTAGYATCHVGKWHLGDDANDPEHQGFDENHGGCDYGQPPSYFDPFRNERLPQGIPTLPPRRPGQFLTERETEEAVDFVARHRAQPFFLYLAHYAVHTPIQAKEEVAAKYAAKATSGAQRNAKYAAMVESVDDAMGRVLAALDEHGLSERTLVIFTSDNGGLLGPTDNAPLRSGKGFPYEGGIRVPLLMRWPGVVEAGRLSHVPAGSVDLFATVLAAAEVPAGERTLDGVSLLPHLRGAEVEPPARPLFWHFPHYRDPVPPYGIVRDGDWKLIVWYEGPTFELYDLAHDLSEKRDLAGAQPERVERMHGMLRDHLAGAGAKLPRANPAYVPLPRVLVLGDSISIGYMDAVRDGLRGAADVFRPMRDANAPENCAGTTHAVERVDAWLAAGGGRWDVIHFNFGLHDLKHVRADTGANSDASDDPRQAEPEAYERQLRAIVAKLEATGARLIFATTTPVPEGRVRPLRSPDDVVRYNDIARRVMAERGIDIDDLYALALPKLADWQQPTNVHFKPTGYRALGARVAAQVRAALARR